MTAAVMLERHPSPPPEWEARLRADDPKSQEHSWLQFVWYVPGQRWVLYDMKPKRCLLWDLDHGDKLQGGYLRASELLELLNGPAPETLTDPSPFVSQVQWDLWHEHEAYGKPWFVLQGPSGGHQVAFDPWQKNLLSAQGLPSDPPPIGRTAYLARLAAWEKRKQGPAPVYLEPAPFDGRMLAHIRRANRLKALGNSLGALRESGNKAHAAQAMQQLMKEMRKAELEAVEAQMRPVVEMAMSLHTRSDARDHLIYVDGAAAAAKERLDYWLETGNYVHDVDDAAGKPSW